MSIQEEILSERRRVIESTGREPSALRVGPRQWLRVLLEVDTYASWSLMGSRPMVFGMPVTFVDAEPDLLEVVE